MKREIKFRYYDKVVGVFKYSDKNILDFIMDCGNSLYEADEYTGLKDKDRKEIYEGDIVTSEEDSIIGRVVWVDELMKEKEYAQFGIRDDINKEFYWFAEHYPPSHLKIIGNIYENLEVMEE